MQLSRPCPQCGKYSLYRSRSRNFVERTLKSISPLKTYRCHDCNWRGWLSKRKLAGKKSILKSLLFYIILIIVSLIVAYILKGMLR